MSQFIRPINYPVIKIRKNPTFSLPIFILIISSLLVSFGFWNMYTHEIKRQTTLAFKPNMYNSIKDLTDQTKKVINQSVTVTNINIIDKVEKQTFMISDGNNVLLIIIPENFDIKTIDDEISNAPDFLTIRGVVRPFNQETIKQYHLSVENYPLLQKQRIYLEITEPPNVDYKLFESNILDNADSI